MTCSQLNCFVEVDNTVQDWHCQFHHRACALWEAFPLRHEHGLHVWKFDGEVDVFCCEPEAEKQTFELIR